LCASPLSVPSSPVRCCCCWAPRRCAAAAAAPTPGLRGGRCGGLSA
jgi:hypothetical protein